METTKTQTQTPILLTVKGVAQIVQASRAFIYQEEAAGRFPKRVKLGTRWRAAEIHAWIAAKTQSRDQVTGG
jgi:predicted DNA-binding transcriptional regulator AlpA